MEVGYDYTSLPILVVPVGYDVVCLLLFLLSLPLPVNKNTCH